MTETFTLDARGLACPQPVMETKKILDSGQVSKLRVLVDNVTSRENVARFAGNQGCNVNVVELEPNLFEIHIGTTKSPELGKIVQKELLPCRIPESSEQCRLVVYIGSNCMGSGSDELGKKLMRGFLRTSIDVGPIPWRMIFINSGVKLTTVDDDAVEALGMLEDRGVEILSCGTCLEHFGLVESLRVGKPTNMFEVIESLNAATKVVSPS
jgi:selenium metabolism protein YedF